MMYKLETTPKITKELLLSTHTQEDYMEYYLGVPVKKGLFRSPSIIRIDNTPTCSFYKNKKGVLMFKDFAGPSFDFIGAVSYLFQCSYYKALKIIANDFGFIKDEKYEINPPKMELTGIKLNVTKKANIQVEIKDFSEKELEWWNKFGIGLNSLKKFKVYSIKSVFLNGQYFTSSTETTPIYGYYGGENSDEDELWRLYFPTKRNYRFITNWSSTMIQGSKQLPKTGEYIIVTKSLKDVMSLYEFGITAIAPNSENTFLTEAQYEKIKAKFKQIYIFYDNDLPGIKSANKIRKKFENLEVIFIPKKYKVKDFTDFVKKYGTTKTFKLIDEWLEKRKKNS